MDLMDIEFKYHIYCFFNDKGAVFINRYGEHIKQFSTYSQAIEYAQNNFDLINYRL